MLEHAETSPDIQAIISWQPHGRSFKIKDKKRLQNEVLPLFFATGQYDSFRRNLNHWGFKLVNGVKNPDYKSYYHKLFLRTRRDLCSKIKRVQDISSADTPELTSSDVSSSPSPSHKIPFFSEPNFHEMEWLPSSQQESFNQEQTNTDDISTSTANVSNITHSSHQSSSTIMGSNKSIISNNSSHSTDHVSTSINIPSTRKNHISKEAEWKTSLDETIPKVNGFREQSVESVTPLHFASSAQCCANDGQKPDPSAALKYIQEVLKLDRSTVLKVVEKVMIERNIPFADHTSPQHTLLQENRPNRPNTTSRKCIQDKGTESNKSTKIVQNVPPSIAIHTSSAGNKSSDINQVLTSTNEIKTTLSSIGTKRKRTTFRVQECNKEEAAIHDLGDDFWDERGWGEFLLEQYFLLPHDLPKLCTVFETT